jgi:hypothetical protein
MIAQPRRNAPNRARPTYAACVVSVASKAVISEGDSGLKRRGRIVEMSMLCDAVTKGVTFDTKPWINAPQVPTFGLHPTDIGSLLSSNTQALAQPYHHPSLVLI